jgi:hypothetical protein
VLNGRIIADDDWKNSKSGCGMFKVSGLFQNLLRTEDNHEKSGSAEPIYCQRCEP